MTPKLPLHEAILLLGLHDETGRFRGSMANYALAGAILAELEHGGFLRTGRGAKAAVECVGERAPEDPLLAEVFERIRVAERRRSLAGWVSRLGNAPRLHHRVAAGLVRAGVLREQEVRNFLVFKCRRYPTRDRDPEAAVLRRIRAAMARPSRDADARTADLIALALHASLLKSALGPDELKRRRDAIREIARASAVGEAVRKTIAGANAAIIAGAVVVLGGAAGS